MRRRRIGAMSWAAKNATERCQNAAAVTAFSSSRASVSGTPGHLTPVNDTDLAITCTGSWSSSSGRSLGDVYNDVHATTTTNDDTAISYTGGGWTANGTRGYEDAAHSTQTNGDTASLTFTGTAVSGRRAPRPVTGAGREGGLPAAGVRRRRRTRTASSRTSCRVRSW
ncbi:hypothetical protein AB0M29_42520 [Streptomyces sp. NPDC051976]|uniref:hypothetical protein n=1 Tax=Streptomyces sp. NPDC051976 TaxID=3154947 RepID=UPI003436E818